MWKSRGLSYPVYVFVLNPDSKKCDRSELYYKVGTQLNK